MSGKREPETRDADVRREDLERELAYLRACAERTAAKVLSLDLQSMGIRHELEQKRRGFALMAELAVSLSRESKFDNVLTSVGKRFNSLLNMQRTVILLPEEGGDYRPAILRGYSPEEAEIVAARRIELGPELLDTVNPVLITGADPAPRCSELREALALPYLISSPVVLYNEVVAVLVTGRVVEQMPWMPRLMRSDAETVQTVSAYLSAILAGQRLVEAEERTKIMLDAMPLCCNFWDEHYNNIDCNEEAARLFGLSSKEEYLDRFNELSPKYQPNGRLSAELASEKVREAYAEGWVRFEWMHQKPDTGEPIPAEVTLVRVRHGDGFIVAGYTRDLRELKATLAEMRKKEDELRHARDLAEKSARAKSEFLANMSHEIRTPMNAVLGMMHLIGETEMTGKQADYLEKAEHSAKLLLRIIDDILDFSKIDVGRLKIENTTFSLRRLMTNVQDMLVKQLDKNALHLAISVGSDVPDLLNGDPLRLEQVVLNLANNAIKFTSEGTVDIRVSRRPSFSDKAVLLFEVEDSGIGMSAEQVAALFTPFTQADTSTTRKYGGTGLGLAISKSLVNLMGGEIWCESEEGRGTKFSFSIIFAAPTEADLAGIGSEGAAGGDAPAGSVTEETYEDLRGLHVLLAEDNEINQMIAEEMLASKGIAVDTVSNGVEALAALERKRYDLVLMDIQMPEMDGLTTTGKIRENCAYKKLPIIAMTAHAMAGDREVSLAGGMNDHITKPISPNQLYAALRRWDRRERA